MGQATETPSRQEAHAGGPLGQVHGLVRQRFVRAMDRPVEDVFFSGTTTATTGAPVPALTLDDILEAKRMIDAIPRVPALPQLLRMPWPKKQSRTHRKKRINKKWLKRYGMIADISVDDGKCFTFPDFISDRQVVAAYPITFELLRREVQKAWPAALA